MPKVLVYSTPTCPYCKMAKQFLNENKIKFQDFNVAEDQVRAQEMIKKTGQTGVPVIDVDGEIVIGFDKGKLLELLNIGEEHDVDDSDDGE